MFYILFILFSTSLSAQDLHFSQFSDSPLNLNPALAGVFNGDFRWVGNYRSQWSSVTIPYSTSAASLDLPIVKTASNNFIGIGGSAFIDKAGDSGFKTTQFNFAFSYDQTFSSSPLHRNDRKTTQTVSLGMMAGYGQVSIDPSGLIFDSQFDGRNLNNNLPGESLPLYQFFYPDISLGFLWSLTTKYIIDQFDLYLGGAWYHLNFPNRSFMGNNGAFLYPKYVVHAGSQFKLNDRIYFLPTAVYFLQGPSTELMGGTYIKYVINPSVLTKPSFYAGAWYRLQDAWTVGIKFYYDNIIVGYSYDINSSDLYVASNLRGANELSITFMNPKPSRKKPYRRLECPVFGS
ncbi:MAG: hypothetical protein A3H98_02445 [Bacteroidetes bacterium RIFCSPLOWO2_02_FULL_36_8]|nr:MAG: hypothetical protein A3H98_02445 [Bacteroidetes bacterium RIFCSPLOWO2_02_FULL_36_8]OFY71031.1 MAG: hypothetical protein A3G23_13035 [Bacteroidetes bacterium RIFCSPLOWO2_12_FULL_37_12]